MTRFLAIVSILLAFQISCLANQVALNGAEDDVEETTESYQYNIEIAVRGRLITGICLIEVAHDGNTIGTIVNEFGMKALDFEYKEGRMRLHNIFKPINKWYIKRIIRKDLQFLFDNFNSRAAVSKGKRRFEQKSDGSRIMTNEKYNISYTLSETTTEQ